tara:strand:+ start:3277 stop:3528 length:252 start_codon:yes stop_codon:yes gene_type:complete
MAKQAKINMGDSGVDIEDWVAYRWCIKNNIYIAAMANTSIKWHVDITNNGKTHRDPEVYGKTDIWIKIFEYCKYYYNKHKDKK